MLANLYLLMLPQLHGLKVRIIDRYQEIFLIRHNAQVDGQAGDIISLLPFKGNAEGVRPLDWNIHYPTKPCYWNTAAESAIVWLNLMR